MVAARTRLPRRPRDSRPVHSLYPINLIINSLKASSSKFCNSSPESILGRLLPCHPRWNNFYSVIPNINTAPSSSHFFPFASSAALILSLAARLPPSFGPEDAAAPAEAADPPPALALTAGCLRERFRASACARKSALKAAAAAASRSRPSSRFAVVVVADLLLGLAEGGV